MKKTILFTTAILIFTNAFTQIKQGTWTAGGALNYYKNSTYNDSYSYPNAIGKTMNRQFGMNLNGGYFIKDNLVIGISPNYYQYKSTSESTQMNSNYINYSDYKSRNNGISPFLRYYKQLFNSKLSIFGQAALNFSLANSPQNFESKTSDGLTDNFTRRTSKGNTYGISLSPGINYFITDKIALQVYFAGLTINSTRTKLTETYQYGSTITTSSHREKNIYSTFNLNLSSISFGVQFFFEKKNSLGI